MQAGFVHQLHLSCWVWSLLGTTAKQFISFLVSLEIKVQQTPASHTAAPQNHGVMLCLRAPQVRCAVLSCRLQSLHGGCAASPGLSRGTGWRKGQSWGCGGAELPSRGLGQCGHCTGQDSRAL